MIVGRNWAVLQGKERELPSNAEMIGTLKIVYEARRKFQCLG